MDGLDSLLGNLQSLRFGAPEAMRAQTRAQAEDLLERARGLAPKLTGQLADSGRLVESPEGWDVVFDAPYAAKVHEELQIRHANGQAKYLEVPLVENLDRYAEENQQALNRALEQSGG